MRIYLAGPTWNSDHKDAWRDRLTEEKDFDHIEWVNPRDTMEYDPDEHEPGRVVHEDKTLIESSDAVLVGDTGERSVGTWREVEFALCDLGLPVAIWTNPYDMGNWDYRTVSPWLSEVGPAFANPEHCIEWLVDQAEDREQLRAPQMDKRTIFMCFDVWERAIIQAAGSNAMDVAAEYVDCLFRLQEQLPTWTEEYQDMCDDSDAPENQIIADGIAEVGRWAVENDHEAARWFDGVNNED